MPRRPRTAMGGYAYHVLNRGVGRLRIFEKTADYSAFEEVLREAKQRVPMRVLAYCSMPNHWHLVLWPREDDDLSEFMRWLTVTHSKRWHAHRRTSGTGPVYQGRYKSFPVEADEHFLWVCRYVERNPLRANLVRQAGEWRWSSLWHRIHESGEDLLDAWPVPVPRRWVQYVERAETEAELAALRRSVVRGTPYGKEAWQKRTAGRLHLETTLRPRGRPRKRPKLK